MRRRLLTGLLVVCAALSPARAEHGAKAEKREPAKKEEKKDEKGKAPEHKITQSESYLMLDPIYTTIVADNRPTGLLMIAMPMCATCWPIQWRRYASTPSPMSASSRDDFRP